MNDLDQLEDSIFANTLKDTIRVMLDSCVSKLDPKEFRGLYIKKIYNDVSSGRYSRQIQLNDTTGQTPVNTIGSKASVLFSSFDG